MLFCFRKHHSRGKMNFMVFGVFVLVLYIMKCDAGSGAHDIWDYLFLNSSYNKEVRPVKQWSTPTVVNVSIAVIAIIDFDEVKQTIVLTSKVTFTWKDEYLVWNPQDFENISHIHVSQAKIWKPFVVLENSVTRQGELGTPSLQVLIYSDGVIKWEPVEVFQTTCATDVRKFPFDTQKCSIVFEALGYTGNELMIQSNHDHVHFHEYGGTTGWTVVDTEMATKAEEDANMHVICSLTLERNPVYFILNIFLPIVLLSFMNICVFLLPVQSGEKASFVITVFLALAVFLTIVSGNLPENSDTVSLLNVYVFMNTLLGVLIAMITILQIRLYHRDREIPVAGCLAKFAKVCTSKPRNTTDVNGILDNDSSLPVTKKSRQSIIDIQATIDENNIPRITYNAFLSNYDITWPRVVKAFDNIFFLVFLTINLTVTIVIFVLALQDDDIHEVGHGDH